jgi:quercetin dioxygenase-like cupin family protein
MTLSSSDVAVIDLKLVIQEEAVMTTAAIGAGQTRLESIHSGNRTAFSLEAGVWIREFASSSCGALGFSTGTATLEPCGVLQYHRHGFSEAIVILSGVARVAVEGRSYHLEPFDCVHVPKDVAHEIRNVSSDSPLVMLWAFASAEPSHQSVEQAFAVIDRGLSIDTLPEPETVVRSTNAERYELSAGAEFCDLFAKRLGSVGICGGYGRFQPGASLPCHIHKFDESITIVEGEATCLVQGRHYRLCDYSTAFVPEGRPHRFLNQSKATMAMVWVYAGSEPERTLVDAAYCDGTLNCRGQV